MRLFRQFQSSRNCPWIVSEKNAEGIFLLLNLPFEIGDLGGRGVDQLFRLPHVEQTVKPVFLQRVGQLQRFLSQRKRMLRYFQLKIEGANLEIRVRNIGYQCGSHRPLSPITREQLGSGSFSRSTISSPEVGNP